MICTKCHAEKALSEFHKHAKRHTGYAAWCKACCAINMRQQYECRRDTRIRLATEANRRNANRKEILKKSRQKDVEELRDSYIRSHISANSRIPYALIPQELVNVYRELKKLRRELNDEKCT